MQGLRSFVHERARSTAARVFRQLLDELAVTQAAVGRVESLMLTVLKELARHKRYPVTVSVLGVTLMPDPEPVESKGAWSPLEPELDPDLCAVDPELAGDLATLDALMGAAEPYLSKGAKNALRFAPSALTRRVSIVGAKTRWLSAGEERVFEFSFPGPVRSGAMVWVTGPGLLTSVVKSGVLNCQFVDGAGMVFMVPEMIHLGQLLACRVVGAPYEPIGGDDGSDS